MAGDSFLRWRGFRRFIIAVTILYLVQETTPETAFNRARDRPRHVARFRHSRHLENGGRPFNTKPFQATKLAVKDNHKPIFKECSNYKPSVKEDQSPGTYVFTVKAEDQDPLDMGGTVTYTFVTTPGEKQRFHVGSDSGVITTADVFDHDEPSREKEAYITVRASDNGQPRLDDACTIKIIIEDINDNPPVFDKVSYSESVPADLPVGREVMRISATDIDDGDNSIVSYSLDPHSQDVPYFYIDRDNGVIFLNRTIDKSPGYKFKLSAVVKDKGTPPQQSSITLDIQVVESNKKSPSFLEVPDEPIRLKENFADFNKAIATIRATSNIPGEEQKLQFELVQGQTEQTNKWHTFVMEPEGDTAYIKLGGHLDYEKVTDYSLTVRIQNNYRLAAETIIYIQIEDVNDNIPIFTEVRTGTVLENEPVGTQVMQVRAIDSDATAPHNQVTYELGDSSEPFAIDPVTGNITTLKMFDREERSFYNIKIIATDNSESALIPGKHNAGQQTFLIEIADKNDNPPHFTQDTYFAESIAENANVNELVTQVNALDIDTASVVSYSIVAGNTYDAFTIRNFTGEIRVNSELDYENITSYSLDVRAFDGIYEDYAKVIIKIENLNDNPPVFVANYTKTIEEEKLYEGCVVRVEAYDPDIKDRTQPQNIFYSLVKVEQMAFLEIDNEGCLRLTKPLDRDPPNGYAKWQIIIMAADHGGRLGSDSLRSTTEVILTLTDINDNKPFLTNTQPVIWYENEPPGQVVTLAAKDNDSEENGPPFTFALDETDANFQQHRAKFQIQGNILFAITTFDREEVKEYWIPILITDSGTPRLTGLSVLHVIIGDKNDNAMSPGFSTIFVYNYRGEAPDTEVGRVYVEDPDDWDNSDKGYDWLPSYEDRNPNFDVHRQTGMIIMKEGTPPGDYLLRFNVSERNEPVVPYHWVVATVNVSVKEIPEEAVIKSGSIRFVNIAAEAFIIPEADGTSKKDKLHRRLSKMFNVSRDNVDVFTVLTKQTVKELFLDVRFSAHGSPYYSPEKLNTMVTDVQEKIEDELQVKVFMIGIDECIIEKEQCEDSCRNVLIKNNVPLAVYTNTTSFIGVSARDESECTCERSTEPIVCMNGGTPFANKCECLEGYQGPRCEQLSVGFAGDGWAMYPPPPPCSEGHIGLTVTAHTSNSLVFYMGPQKVNKLLGVHDFMSLELVDGYPVLLVNYGAGTTRINNSVVHVSDGKPHLIEIVVMRSSIEMFVDKCKLTTCMSLAAPTGPREFLNINGPLQIGGVNIDLKALAKEFQWRYVPNDTPLVGCVFNFTYNDYTYNLGAPSYAKNIDISCQRSMFTAVTFGIDTNFLVAILVCIAILIILLLAVVVHRRRADAWAEKELDDIRENIIAYEDEGGGEGDAGYDLHVLRQMYDGRIPDTDGFVHSGDSKTHVSIFTYLVRRGLVHIPEGGIILQRFEPVYPGVPGVTKVHAGLPPHRLDNIISLEEAMAFPNDPAPRRYYRNEEDNVLSFATWRGPDHPVPPSPRTGYYHRIIDNSLGPLAIERQRFYTMHPRLGVHIGPSGIPVEQISMCRAPHCLGLQAMELATIEEEEPPFRQSPIRTTRSGICVPGGTKMAEFLDDKKNTIDQDPDTPPDDVRHYAYEGDGNTSGSLSSLASCTDEGDLTFGYLSTFGPRFRKLADMYGDSDEAHGSGHRDARDARDAREGREAHAVVHPHEESWC